MEMMVALAMAEYDDEPLDPDDEQTFEADREEYIQGKTMSAEEAKELYL